MPLINELQRIYGPWAVITGASSGIGAEFCRQLACAGLSLVMVDRQVDKMERLSSEIRSVHTAVEVKTIALDLNSEEAVDVIIQQIASLDVGLFVNNAGIVTVGSFLSTEPDDIEELIALNVKSHALLAHPVGRKMANRHLREDGSGKRAGMLMISSIDGVNPVPFFSVYSASKAFVSTLGTCLRAELAPNAIDVCVIEPGVVDTDLASKALQYYQNLNIQAMPAHKCVRLALRAFLAGKPRFTPGFRDKCMLFFSKLIPEEIRMPLVAKVMRMNCSNRKMVTYE